ncbi:hypothetical protein RJT34_03719 [Clitoria ternatea]|uniref:F-box protein At3g26010-like beta-propeller domain-containing protein n=1 Tax=Clitoria ternatea TaxID=43366 RepID=A0AAN9Q009_CLITE
MAFPYDNISEIFSWLPTKAIYKFTSCNKLLSKFPEEPYFALKQAQNALLRDDTCFFIQHDTVQWYNSEIELHPLSQHNELSCGVSNDVLLFLSKHTNVISSSNGLILCRLASEPNKLEFFIVNPATQWWLPIPIPEHLHVYQNLRIGFECDSKGCMVFVFDASDRGWCSNLDYKVHLYKDGEWKTREERFFTGGRNLIFDNLVYYNGAIHIISDCFSYISYKPYIVSYNFTNGESRMLSVPTEATKNSDYHDCKMRIFKWGKVNSSSESICLVRLRNYEFTVWALVKYESGLWKRVLKVGVEAMGLMEEDPTITGFVVLNGDVLVFATKKKIYGYDLSNEKYTRIQEI